jgi:DNA-binding winged helix-turn-helix (wHTH) protein
VTKGTKKINDLNKSSKRGDFPAERRFKSPEKIPVKVAAVLKAAVKATQRLEKISDESVTVHSIRELLKLGHLQFEKCELSESRKIFEQALSQAKQIESPRLILESISSLLYIAGEAIDYKAIEKWEAEISEVSKKYKTELPPLVWYCRASVEFRKEDLNNLSLVKKLMLKFLRMNRQDSEVSLKERETWEAKAFLVLVLVAIKKGLKNRAHLLLQSIESRYYGKGYAGIDGLISLYFGLLNEYSGDLPKALTYFKQAHGSFLSEHHWYFHLYVLQGYARIARAQRQFGQALFYLDLIEKAASGPEFNFLRVRVQNERLRLERDTVDLFVDVQKGIVQTREGEKISLRKQYVLMDILKVLSIAFLEGHSDEEKVLSKAEIINKVWRENYRPEAHDNKLYYNINRLRKLIEPNIKVPKYILNWKEGYRFAPGLNIKFVGEDQSSGMGFESFQNKGEKNETRNYAN